MERHEESPRTWTCQRWKDIGVQVVLSGVDSAIRDGGSLGSVGVCAGSGSGSIVAIRRSRDEGDSLHALDSSRR